MTPPPGLAPRIAFCEKLRAEGVAVGTAELLDAFEALDAVPWTEPADFREALAATIAVMGVKRESERVL